MIPDLGGFEINVSYLAGMQCMYFVSRTEHFVPTSDTLVALPMVMEYDGQMNMGNSLS